jgi:hypothetical protein
LKRFGVLGDPQPIPMTKDSQRRRGSITRNVYSRKKIGDGTLQLLLKLQGDLKITVFGHIKVSFFGGGYTAV